jgi:hypothetical protein
VRIFSREACVFAVAHNSPTIHCGENRNSNGFYFFAANYISSQSDFRIFISSVIFFQNGGYSAVQLRVIKK